MKRLLPALAVLLAAQLPAHARLDQRCDQLIDSISIGDTSQISTVRECIRQNPNDEQYMLRIGHMYFLQNDFKTAERWLDEASWTARSNNLVDSESGGRFLGMIKSLQAATILRGVTRKSPSFQERSLMVARRKAIEAAEHAKCSWRTYADIKGYTESVQREIYELEVDTDADSATRSGICLESGLVATSVELIAPTWVLGVNARQLACSRLEKILPIAEAFQLKKLSSYQIPIYFSKDICKIR